MLRILPTPLDWAREIPVRRRFEPIVRTEREQQPAATLPIRVRVESFLKLQSQICPELQKSEGLGVIPRGSFVKFFFYVLYNEGSFLSTRSILYRPIHPTAFRHLHDHPRLFPSSQSTNAVSQQQQCYLHGEQDQERHHQGEQSSSLSEGESQNGITEQLASEGWVAGNTRDQGAEHRADASSGTDETCSCSSGSDQLASAEDGRADRDRLGGNAARLVAGEVGGGVAQHGAAHDEAGVAGGGLEARDGGGRACSRGKQNSLAILFCLMGDEVWS